MRVGGRAPRSLLFRAGACLPSPGIQRAPRPAIRAPRHPTAPSGLLLLTAFKLPTFSKLPHRHANRPPPNPTPSAPQVGLFSLFSSSGETRDEDVRAASQSAIAAWAELAVLPSAGLAPPPPGGAEAALARERGALERIAPVRVRGWNLASLGAGGAAPPPPQQQQQQQQQAQQQQAQQGARGPPGGGYTYEGLMGMRAKDLKGLLADAGVDSRGLFEKEELARRVLERLGR
jgi:hypothetical protein